MGTPHRNKMMLFDAFFIISISLLFVYAFVFLWYAYGWTKLNSPTTSVSLSTSVSVVVAVRNEEKNTSKLLDCISKQDYPIGLLEIIVVDDSSTDRTVETIKEFQEKNHSVNIVLLLLENTSPNPSPKKRAIAEGIKSSKGKLIITTDGDCEMGNKWISSVVSCYEKTSGKMIVSPVSLSSTKHFFEQAQSLEFLSLIGSSGASLYYKKPLMCNGANLAYERSVFFETGAFENSKNRASGDDMFMMLAVDKKYPGQIVFNKSEQAIVTTAACNRLSIFIAQRKRWASKSLQYKNGYIYLISALVYTINISITISVVFSIFYNRFVPAFLFLFIGKSLIDFIFLIPVSSFFNKKPLLIFLLPMQLIYALYVSVAGLFAFSNNYYWKGRQLK